MLKYITLATEKDDFRITALITSKIKEPIKFEHPSFQFVIDGKETDCWDSEEYLVKEVYPYLKNEVESDEFDDLFSNYKEELLDLFEEAFELGVLKR